jgi:hypothetical protein
MIYGHEEASTRALVPADREGAMAVASAAGGLISFEHLSLAAVRALVGPQESPCLSLCMPTHRRVPGNTVDRPTFRHLLEALERSLARERRRDAVERLLAPLRHLEADVHFWEHAQDGLVVLASAGHARVFVLQRPIEPQAVVGDRFHVMPLLRLAAGLEPFDLLALTSRTARVFTGTAWHDPAADALSRLELLPIDPGAGRAPVTELRRADVVDEEVLQPHRVKHGMGPAGMAAVAAVHGGMGSKRDDMDADTEIFLRYVDKVVLEQVSRRSELPLVLVAATRVAATFRGLSRNPFLLAEHVDSDPHLMSADELAAAVQPVFTAAQARRIDGALGAFAEARDHGLACDDLSDVARAAAAGRVARLLVEAGRFEAGGFDGLTGGIEADGLPVAAADPSRTGDVPASCGADLFGAVAESVLLHGGTILALARISMPTESGVAAILRY